MIHKYSILVTVLVILSSNCFAQRLGWDEVDHKKVTPWNPKDYDDYQSVYQFEDEEMKWDLIILMDSGIYCAQRKSRDLGGDKVMISRNYYRTLTNVRIEGSHFYSDQKNGDFVLYDKGVKEFRGLKLYDSGSTGSYVLGLVNSSIQDYYEGIYTEASKRLLKKEELTQLSMRDLQIMRNEIFARYGYKFVAGGKMDDYFKAQDWYTAVEDNVLDKLTLLETKNIDLIKWVENDQARRTVNYSSLIRPQTSAWNLEEIHTDTLIFIYYEDGADLPYAICKTLGGDTLALYHDAFENNSEILGLAPATVLKSKWKLSQFHEPGEGDGIYYSESLESFEPINLSITPINEQFIKPYMDLSELDYTNNINEFSSYDFSPLWGNTRNAIIFGVIGKNNLRIRVKLLSVSKDPSNNYSYKIKGKSLVKKNLISFSGSITIRAIREVKEKFYGVESNSEDLIIQSQGLLIATYRFNEDKTASNGVFEGRLYSKFYIDEDDKVIYDDLYSYAPSYMNNAFVGTWTKYNSDNSIVCKWGDDRIPLISGFGVSEFLPPAKYDAYGWSTIRKAYWEDDKEARKIEEMEWWK